MTSVRTWWAWASSSASALRRSSLRATNVTPWPRRASSRAISEPMPDDAPVTSAVVLSFGVGSVISAAYWSLDRPDYCAGTGAVPEQCGTLVTKG